MTNPIAQDELELAEAVATGEVSLRDAEARLGRSAHSRSEVQDVRDLHRTIAAIRAVRAHAEATHAASAASAASAAGEAGEAFGGRAPAVPPAAEVDGSASGTVPADRPGTVTQVLAGPVRPRSRRAHDGRTLAVAAALVVVAGALGYAFAGSRAILPTPQPSVNGLATTAPSVPPVSAVFKAAEHPEVFDSAVQFALTSATVGWLRTPDAILRTTDAGRTWAQLTGVKPGVARFVDDDTAYVWNPGSSFSVTHDGGGTWRQTATIVAPSGAIGPFLTVAAPDRAFVTFYAAETSTDLLVYATSDGGTTWSGPEHGTVEVLSPEFNKPQGGDHGLLWMTLGKADDKPFDNRVAISADGGATWSIQPLPTDSVFSVSSPKYPTAIRADAGSETLVGSDGDATGIYRSVDAGQTWTRVRAWSGGAIVELRSAVAWTATTATAFWSTTDGGQTWRQAPRDASLPVADVTFATPDVGWAEVVCHHPSWQTEVTPDPLCQGRATGVVLMTTADGGATWAPMGQ